MTAITGIVAPEGNSLPRPLKALVGQTPKPALKHALTSFRMRQETGETARAR